MKKCGIYIIENSFNTKVYIGSSVDIYSRWHHHRETLDKNSHHSKHLQRAWNKYGKLSFKFVVLEEISLDTENLKDYILEREQFYLNKYKSFDIQYGYNIYRYAGSPLGYKHTEITKLKMKSNRTMLKGELHPNFGKRRSKAAIERLKIANSGVNNPFYNKRHTNETKENMSKNRKGKNMGALNPNYGKGLCGEKHFNTKLTNDIVKAIKISLKNNDMTINELAELNSVTPQVIYKIKYGHTWRKVII